MRKRAVLSILIGFSLFVIMMAFNFVYIGLMFIFEAISSTGVQATFFSQLSLADANYFLVLAGMLTILTSIVLSRVFLLMSFAALFTLTNPVPILRFGAYLEA